MTRIAIVEDDPTCAAQLKRYLQRYGSEHNEQFHISCFTDGIEIVEHYRPFYNIILMDIDMPNLNGMDTARCIRVVDDSVILIFITNMAKYAIRGYEVEALDFVLKPVSYFAFSLKLNKALEMLRGREQKRVLISTGDGLRTVLTGDIYYLEVLNHRLNVHTVHGVYTASGSLKEMEKVLTGQNFLRCNKGYLVNLQHITLIKSDSVIVGGDELLISRRKKEEFLLAVTDYYGGGRI